MNKIAQLEKWIKLCEDDYEYDSMEFHTLLMDKSDEEEAKIFSYLPNGDQVRKRFHRYNRKINHSDEELSRNELIESYLKKDLKKKRRILAEMEEMELVEVIDKSPIEFTDNESLEKYGKGESSWPNREMYDLMCDYILEYEETDIHISITEACFGVLNNYYLTWYSVAPVFNFPYDFEYHVRLWEMNVEFLITDKKIYVADNGTI